MPFLGIINCRFIPTRVGSMTWQPGSRAEKTVHPHSRGEHSANCRWTCRLEGSSPLAWGAYLRLCFRQHLGRFIPTRVGSMVGRIPG